MPRSRMSSASSRRPGRGADSAGAQLRPVLPGRAGLGSPRRALDADRAAQPAAGRADVQRDRRGRAGPVAVVADPAAARAATGRGDRDPGKAGGSRVALRADARRPGTVAGDPGPARLDRGVDGRPARARRPRRGPVVVVGGVPAPGSAARPAGGDPVRVRPAGPPGAGVAARGARRRRGLPVRPRVRRRRR